MKKLLSLCLLIGICMAGYAQKIEGIGPFKPGKTTIDIIQQLEQELNTTAAKASDYSYLKYALCELVVDPNNIDKKTPFAPLCPDVRVYYISEYTIANIKITGILLHFYKNILCQFSSDGNMTLTNALEAKYGKPKVDFSEVEKNCGNKMVKEASATEKWEGEYIIVESLLYSKYDKNCEENFHSFIIATEGTTYTIAEDCEEEYSEIAKKEQKNRILETLTDL